MFGGAEDNMMSFIKTPKAIDELNDVLADYFAKRLDEKIDELWANGTFTDEKIEASVSYTSVHPIQTEM